MTVRSPVHILPEPVGQVWLRLVRRLFTIRPAEASFKRRRFTPADPGARARLQRVGRTFLEGYQAALDGGDLRTLACRLGRVDLELQGFAHEGASMGLGLLDLLAPSPSGSRVRAFLAGVGSPHVYMGYVGVGWVAARLPPGIRWCYLDRLRRRFDPMLWWLAIDGWGFHQAYFHPRRFLSGRRGSHRPPGYAGAVFHQGMGRAAWFATGADPSALVALVDSHPGDRRAHLWSGIGLASAYAGGAKGGALERIAAGAGNYRPELAQGAAFAAKARERAGNPAPHTELACRVYCGVTASVAAAITDRSLPTPTGGSVGPNSEGLPDYAVWRQRIRDCFGGLASGRLRTTAAGGRSSGCDGITVSRSSVSAAG